MMNRPILLKIALGIAAVPLLLAATCPPTPAVTIHYKQVGACNGYQRFPGGAPGGAVSASPGAYVGFQITSIENPTSTDFHFDPERLYVQGTSRQHVDTNLAPAVDFGSFKAISRVIPKGTTESHIGMAIVVVSTPPSPDPSSEANKVSYVVEYDTPPGGPGVALSKDNLSQTTWPASPDCTTLFRAFAPLFPQP
jgi:hypothetical protein